jgi:bifunctional DNase/RNase
MAAEQNMIDVRLSRIVIRNGTDQQWIFLGEVDGERGFPIIIGSTEAYEIHRVVTKQQPQRPLTHQLAYASIEALGATLQRVDIVDLRNNTFFAQLILSDKSGDPAVVDARPSDALALGLRAQCPIRVAESVLEQARSDTTGPDPLPDPDPDLDEEF